MGVVAKFFGGMSLTGYIITALVAALVIQMAALGYLNWRNDKLREEVAVADAAILQLVENNTYHTAEIRRLIREIEDCANARAEAEKSAHEARVELYEQAQRIEETATDRLEEINEAIDAGPACDCIVPTDAARLLYDAACSANGDSECP